MSRAIAEQVKDRSSPKTAPRRPRRLRRRIRVLLCSPEISHLPAEMAPQANRVRAKAGGLGEVACALADFLHRNPRFELHVVLPRFDSMLAPEGNDAALRPWELRSRGVHLVHDSAFTRLRHVYGPDANHPPVRQSESFQRYVINHVLEEVRPDVVHCHDWMTGLIPAAARSMNIGSVFTLHNVFTNTETPENLDRGGLDIAPFAEHLYFERFPTKTSDDWKNNRVDFAASGIHGAHFANTVSKTFLEELVSGTLADVAPPGIVRAMKEKVEQGLASGILNAPTTRPERVLLDGEPSGAFPVVQDLMRKKRCVRERFQSAMNLERFEHAPLFFWPNRVTLQKGPELLAEVASRFIERYGIQLAIVADGDRDLVRQFERLSCRYPGKVAVRRFQEPLSELGKVGADFVLMPSFYEPCGLPQMECTRVGTLPVVRATGGLRDTVSELDWQRDCGNGFVFETYSAHGLAEAMGRAVAFYGAPLRTRVAILQRVMRESSDRFSFAHTAEAYAEVYERLAVDAHRRQYA